VNREGAPVEREQVLRSKRHEGAVDVHRREAKRVARVSCDIGAGTVSPFDKPTDFSFT
jgi:hypothetical protein